MHESVMIYSQCCVQVWGPTEQLGTQTRRGTCTCSCVWYHMGHTDLSQEVKQQIDNRLSVNRFKDNWIIHVLHGMIYSIAFVASISFQQVQLSVKAVFVCRQLASRRKGSISLKALVGLSWLIWYVLS